MKAACGWSDYPGAQLSLTVGRFGGFKITANRQKVGIMLGWVLIQLWLFDKSEWDRDALAAVKRLGEILEKEAAR